MLYYLLIIDLVLVSIIKFWLLFIMPLNRYIANSVYAWVIALKLSQGIFTLALNRYHYAQSKKLFRLKFTQKTR